jgi:histidyl-tRNA synthetase
MSIQKPRGTQDILPDESYKWQYIEEKARDVCRRFNYKEIRTPMFESTELFQRGVGGTTDIVAKEMYSFLDKGGRNISLRPEGTAGVVRAYVENKLFGNPEISKLYYTGSMFRYERPMSGRFRQFNQFGVEAFGSVDPAIDAEVIALGYTILTAIGIKDIVVELNSVGTPECREEYNSALVKYFSPFKEQLCSDCLTRLERNPMRLLDCKVDTSLATGAPSIFNYLDAVSIANLNLVKGYLKDFGVPFVITPKLVRGLDYYTYTAFEYTAVLNDSNVTLGGGGRYNGLVGEIGGSDQSGVGLGIGMERVLLILQSQNVEIPEQDSLDVYIISMGELAERKAVSLLYQLRQGGVIADKDYVGRKFKTQFKAAERLNAKIALILGDDEIAKGTATLKNMKTGEQREVLLTDLVSELTN